MKLVAGLTLNSWTLLERDSTRKRYWLCRCSCGKTRPVRAGSLTGKKPSRSCGHDRQTGIGARNRTHGMTGTPTYKSWQWMLYRVRHDPDYLKRGITVCPRWLDFQNFYADMGEKPEGELVSVERTDNNGDYCPQSCHWSNPLEQNNNKGDTVKISSERFGTRSQQEWVGRLIAHTGDTSWTARRLKSTLAGITLDELLTLRGINLDAECAEYADFHADDFVPA